MYSNGNVLILLSTYNGEKYLRELLNSIFRQTYTDFCLLIRDDGSTDETISILEEYSQNKPNMSIIYGKNIGAKNSFFSLLKEADSTFDYYAFADQDDIWLENKLEKAILKLKDVDCSCSLYCSPTILVDSNLALIKENIADTNKHSFGNSLIENIACGCTMVFSKGILHLIKKNGIPEHMYMHDWLIYMLAEAYGKVVMDSNGYILYRQHGDNTVGNAINAFQLLKRRLKNRKKQKQYIMLQAAELAELYELSNTNKQLIELIASRKFINRIRLLFNNRIVRNKPKDNLLFKISWLF